jgi:hypothetical protein
MKTKFFLVIAFFMVSGFIFSQENQKTTNDKYAYKNAIDVAYEVSAPMGDLSDGADASWAGFTARYEFNMGKGWDGMITSGYLSFADKDNQSYSAIPLMIGAKYHFVGGWYGMAETGYHFFSTSGTTKYSDPSEWGFSVGTGYEIPLSDLLSIDISTKYQYNVDDLSYWNTRAGLMFKF